MLDNSSSMSSADAKQKGPIEMSSSDDREFTKEQINEQLYSESLETIFDLQGKKTQTNQEMSNSN